jgi:glucose-6-phosphate 1-dehydrogenase
VEAAWAIVDPVLGTAESTVSDYAVGSWGPKVADNLIDGICSWHDPGADAHGWTRACGP